MGRLRQGLFSTLLTLASLAVSLALVEAYLWYRAGYQPAAAETGSALYKIEDLYVSNRPLAVFDRITGYRRAPGPTQQGLHHRHRFHREKGAGRQFARGRIWRLLHGV
jgi:hypothetical protein